MSRRIFDHQQRGSFSEITPESGLAFEAQQRYRSFEATAEMMRRDAHNQEVVSQLRSEFRHHRHAESVAILAQVAFSVRTLRLKQRLRVAPHPHTGGKPVFETFVVPEVRVFPRRDARTETSIYATCVGAPRTPSSYSCFMRALSDLFDLSIHFISYLFISLIFLPFLLPYTFYFLDVLHKKPATLPLRNWASWPKRAPPQRLPVYLLPPIHEDATGIVNDYRAPW